jgi:hypothetical protein
VSAFFDLQDIANQHWRPGAFQSLHSIEIAHSGTINKIYAQDSPPAFADHDRLIIPKGYEFPSGLEFQTVVFPKIESDFDVEPPTLSLLPTPPPAPPNTKTRSATGIPTRRVSRTIEKTKRPPAKQSIAAQSAQDGSAPRARSMNRLRRRPRQRIRPMTAHLMARRRPMMTTQTRTQTRSSSSFISSASGVITAQGTNSTTGSMNDRDPDASQSPPAGVIEGG